MNPLLPIVGIIWFALALPALSYETSFNRFGRALLAAAFGVMLPLVVFILSAFLVPEWKGACRQGWFDCFHLGKLALTPLVLWATGALYAREVCDIDPPYSRGLVLGLFMGVIVASGCLVYGWIWVCLGAGLKAQTLWLLVPFYVAVWHGFRLSQAFEHSKASERDYLLSFLGSLPLWLGSVLWSRHIYDSLPKNPPQCFVVTAASHGHPALVGPFVDIEHNGCNRRVNCQLAALWHFEALWRSRAPTSLVVFRYFYNRIGPILARRITSPWLADLTYFTLKPMEWTARLTLYAIARQNHPTITQPE